MTPITSNPFCRPDFMALCYTMHALKAARSLWKDEEFMLKVGFVDPLTSNFGMNMPSIIDAYLVPIQLSVSFNLQFYK